MAEYLIKTPYGTIRCHKGRSFGEKVWKKPAPERTFGVAYFDMKGRPLERDVFVHINNKWIPGRGNDKYARRMTWDKWVELGKPKTIDGKTVGIVVRKVDAKGKVVGGEMTLTWNATKEKKLTDVNFRSFVSKDMKYIIPLPEGVETYHKVVDAMTKKNSILITQPVQISSNSSVWYSYAIIPIGRHLVYVEVLTDDLEKPFPPDALIPSEKPTEIGDIEEEDVGDLI